MLDGTDLRGSGVVHTPVDDTVVPLVEPGRVGGVFVDFRCGAVDLGAGGDGCH
jgi:hypothetical protein